MNSPMSSGLPSEPTRVGRSVTYAGADLPLSDAASFNLYVPNISEHLAEEAPVVTQTVWPTEISSEVTAMDMLHHEVIEALHAISACTDQEFSAEFGAFVGKVEHVFCEEDRWMEEIDFPGSKVHREQHARVLGALHHVHSRVMGGEIGLGREVVQHLLPQWFAFHVSTMDATLALALQIASTEVSVRANSSSVAAMSV